MSHSKSELWVHAVFSTKDRQPLIYPSIRSTIHNELLNQLIHLDCATKTLPTLQKHLDAITAHVPRVRNYIQNQEEHHRKLSFQEEYRRFMVHYGLPTDHIG